MKVEVYGPGCPKCQAVERNVFRAVEELGLKGKIQVSKISDLREMARKRIFFTPALFVDGTKVSEGRIPSVEEIAKFLEGKK